MTGEWIRFGLTALCVLASAWCSDRYRMTPRVVIQALDEGARGAVGVGAACVIIGIIIGTVSLTGLGLTFGYEVLKYVGEGQLYPGAVEAAAGGDPPVVHLSPVRPYAGPV